MANASGQIIRAVDDGWTRHEKRHGPLVPPADHEALELNALATVQEQASKIGDSPHYKDIQVEDVRLGGEFPRTYVAVLFRWSRHPAMLFGRKRWIWEPDGSYATHEIGDLLTFLAIDLSIRRRDLPPHDADDEGIRWH